MRKVLIEAKEDRLSVVRVTYYGKKADVTGVLVFDAAKTAFGMLKSIDFIGLGIKVSF